MNIKVLSDLHIEFNHFKITYDNEDILILAGDIHPEPNIVKKLILQYLSLSTSSKVILVLGNHDYYNSTIEKTEQFYKNLNIDRFFFLQNTHTTINNITFFGSTMWTNILDSEPHIIKESIRIVNDYTRIKNINPDVIQQIHIQSKKALTNTLNTISTPVVVITHHLPNFQSINYLYKNCIHKNTFISTDLDHFFDSYQIPLWIHGHTHVSMDYIINNTRVLCNPRGHSERFHNLLKIENKKFNPKLIIEYKNNYTLDNYCKYSFIDLANAADTDFDPIEYMNNTKDEQNEIIRYMSQKAGWSWKNINGDDGKIYTAFSPKIV